MSRRLLLHLHGLVHTGVWIHIAECCFADDYANGGCRRGGGEGLGRGPLCRCGSASACGAGARRGVCGACGRDLTEAKSDRFCCSDCLSLLGVQSEPDRSGLRVAECGKNERECGERYRQQSVHQAFVPTLSGGSLKTRRGSEVKHLIDREPLHQDLGRSGVLVKNYFSTIKERGRTSILDQLPIAGPKLFDDLMNCGRSCSHEFSDSLSSLNPKDLEIRLTN